MNYNIFDNIAPAMPKPSKGTEFCKLLLSQASKDMQEPLVPMLFPVFGAHVSSSEFLYLTSFGRSFVAKWPISLRKVGVIRINCPIL